LQYIGRHLSLLAVVVLGLLVAYHAHNFQHWTSDTLGLLNGAGVIDRCLGAHKWSCGSAGFGYVGPSALLQYIPGVIFHRIGLSLNDALRWMVDLNTISYILTLVLVWRTGRKIGGVRLAALLALVVAASPLLFYANGGFGEGLGLFFVTAFTCAVVTRANGVVLGLTLVGAAISKEPALPFLLGLAFVVLRHPPPAGGPRLRRGQAIGLAVGSAAALAVNIGFNAFRSGEGVSGARPLTSSLTHIGAPAPTLFQKAEAAVSLFLAPNVGLLWVWPVALGCVVIGLLAAYRRSPSLRGLVGSPAAGALLVMLLLVAGTASFATPYGFSAWGPRYLVPWMPSFAIVAVCTDWPACCEVIDRLRARARLAVPIAIAVGGLAFSHLAAFLNPLRVYDHFGPGGKCPTALNDITTWYQVHGEVDSYYRCTRYLAWTKGPLLLSVDRELLKASSAGYVVLYAGVLTTLMAGALGAPLPALRRPRALAS
jgi:hypothetical protein